jgi:regulator of sirC expression with transglutaminase-like and TPR domain
MASLGDSETKDGGDEPERVLRTIGRAGAAPIDLAGAALLLAALDRPRVDLARYRHHLAALASEVGAAFTGAPDVRDCVAALSQVIVGGYGYAGDRLTYDDLQNANLMRVIDRRRGLPVALGILYIHAARAQGWQMAGLAFPGHFLLRLDHAGERAIIDPFNEARICGPAELRGLLKAVAGEAAELEPEHYATVSDRDILLRLENNVKLRQLQAGQHERARETLRRMLLFAEDQPGLWYETALVEARLGNLRAATEAAEQCSSRTQSTALRHQAAALLQQLRGRLN